MVNHVRFGSAYMTAGKMKPVMLGQDYPLRC